MGTIDGLAIRSATGEWSSFKDPAVTTMPVNTVKVTSNGWIWVGTQGRGFYINDGTGYEQIYVSTFENVNAIEEDSKQNIYLGTDNGLLKWDGSNWTVLTTSNGLPDNDITSLFLDSQDKIWVGTSGGLTVAYLDNLGLHQVSLMNGTAGAYIRDIYEDKRGDLWFATWFDGLICYDGVIPHSYKKYNGFFENDVNCIGEDKDGNMWFGLYSKGLVKYTLPIE
jgi:ligand-binding sensor domain-containing protein